jgi:hypothetical protein
MTHYVRRRFWVELALAVASAALLVLTLVWNDWVELVFHVDPDAGSGALEWSIIIGLLCAALALAALVRVEWRRALSVPGA